MAATQRFCCTKHRVYASRGLRATAPDKPKPKPARKTKPDDPATAQRKEDRKRLQAVHDSHEVLLLGAMRNAPPGKTNNPMTNRASKAVAALWELWLLDPLVAASQVPALRCREYCDAGQLAEWLATFAAACEARRQAETPQLKPLLGPRWEKERQNWQPTAIPRPPT
jgi:hypothetical protein